MNIFPDLVTRHAKVAAVSEVRFHQHLHRKPFVWSPKWETFPLFPISKPSGCENIWMQWIISLFSHSHLHGSLRTEIRLHHILQALGARDVDGQRLRCTRELRLRVQQANRRHFRSIIWVFFPVNIRRDSKQIKPHRTRIEFKSVGIFETRREEWQSGWKHKTR